MVHARHDVGWRRRGKHWDTGRSSNPWKHIAANHIDCKLVAGKAGESARHGRTKGNDAPGPK